MDRTPVSSSNISAIGYDSDSEMLEVEFSIAHLLEDVRVTRFVDLEGFPAMRADDFVHV